MLIGKGGHFGEDGGVVGEFGEEMHIGGLRGKFKGVLGDGLSMLRNCYVMWGLLINDEYKRRIGICW